jgi:hypothetical protein
MKDKDLEIVFVMKLIELGNKELLEVYKELLQDRLDEVEERNLWMDELREEIRRFKFRTTGWDD